MANFPSLLDPATNAPVMRVTSPVASYWRANALDNFDGTAWLSALVQRRSCSQRGRSGTYSYAVPARDPAPQGKR